MFILRNILDVFKSNCIDLIELKNIVQVDSYPFIFIPQLLFHFSLCQTLGLKKKDWLTNPTDFFFFFFFFFN